jgi:hypothetical protein
MDFAIEVFAAPLDREPAGFALLCVRSLLHLAHRDHAYAERHRNTGLRPLTRRCTPRTDRLRRSALLADARATDLVMEVR